MPENKRLTIVFVEEYMPPKEAMLPDTLYISLKYETTAHPCACGWCGWKVHLPIHRPGGWTLTIGETGVTLHPSIGNWQFPCKSHYWIRDSMVIWA